MAKKNTADEDIEKSKTNEKKAAAKKTATKKTAAKKVATKKTTAKKAPTKTATKKTATKKTTAKKSSEKKEISAAPAVKKVEVEVKKETFSSEFLSLEKQTHPNCKITYIARPEKALWDQAEKDAIKKISKEVSIPGFRKGKAPAKMIVKKHPQGVKQETESILANLTFSKAQELGKTPILHGNTNVNFHIEGEGENKSMIFSFQSEPVIPELDYSAFSLEKQKAPAVDDKRVEEEIDNVRAFYATWDQIEDRGAEIGDYLVLDIDDIDQDPPVQVFNGARFEYNEGKMAQWMQDLVKGKKAGESIEGVSKPDENATKEDKENFKEKKILIRVVSIESRTLPPVDDSLAEKVGAKDLATMKTNLKTLTENKDKRMAMEKYRSEIEKQLIENVVFEVPAALLEKEANHRMEQLLQNAAFKKRWENEMNDAEKESKKEEIKEKSVQAIRLFYLCREIVAKNKISVSETDMQAPLTDILSMMYADQKVLQYQSMDDNQKQMALTQLMMQKAEDHIIEKIL